MITVLGAGVAGLCAATALAEAGHRLRVVQPAGVAPVSLLAGGMIAPWCEGETAPAAVTDRGRAALDWWRARAASFQGRGTLVIAPARDGAELDRFARDTTGHHWVDPGDLEPALAGRFVRALFFAEEGHLDPAEALDGLRAGLAARGVGFLDHLPDDATTVIDCRGLAARDMLPDLRAVRGETALVDAPDVGLTRTVRLLHPRFPCYIVPRGQGRFLIGATMVESDDDGPITARAVVELLSAAYTVDPAFGQARLIATAAGLRPAFPDNLPALRHEGGRIHVNGMYRHGFLMAPVLAADLVAALHKGIAYAH
ncbi:FAD-dependent oxidoreductase [Paracoccus sp. p4-l81]|uniref:FAD-dependent oxidoreductase n=1 Tax=Paracoccus sp. p4-l81 TaxID=3342806 RepID=UPI0035B97D01